MNKTKLIEELAKLRRNATFLNIKNYTSKTTGEVADFSLIFHMSYKNSLTRSVEILENYVPETEIALLAKEEQLKSYNDSLLKIELTEIPDIDDGYSRFFTQEGEYIKGIKLNDSTGELYLYGLVQRKIVRKEGVYKQVKSKPLTLEKARLRRLCPVDKFRQFILNEKNCEKVCVEGIDILI